jgi:sugar phosphate isomerase/epimerase
MGLLNQFTIISDEISQDLEHVLKIITEYRINTVELRSIWGKNIIQLTDEDLGHLKDTLKKYNVTTSVISGPFGKCPLPNSKFAKTEGSSFSRNPQHNLSLFDRLIEISDALNTPYIRIFAFFKFGVKSTESTFKEIKEILQPYVKKAEQHNKILVLENEHVCLNDTIKHSIQILEDLNSPALKLNLDPGNFYSAREPTTPEAYQYFYDHNLMGHMHVKDPKRKIPFLGATFSVVGEGKIDYKAIFKQASESGYKGYISLETHSHKNKEVVSIQSIKNIIAMLKDL